MAAVLDAGPCAVASHRTAAALWRLPGFPPDEVEVSRRWGRTPRLSDLGTVHRTRLLPPHHLTVVEGIAVTTVPRTLFDLAGVLHPKRTERALDNALARHLTTLAALIRITSEVAKRGREGSALMRRLLEDRGADYVPPESGLEARFFAILREAGLPLPLPQRDLGGDRWVGRVDYLDPEFPVVYELDSSLHHSSALDRAADARRDAELAAAGFRVCRLRESDVWHHPDRVLAAVVAVRRAAA